MKKVYAKYGANDKPTDLHDHKHIRNLAMNWACQAHLPECINDTRELFIQFKNGAKAFSLDHKSSIMCNGVINGTEEDYNNLWTLYLYADASEKTLILKTIGCIEDQNILEKYILKYNSTLEWLTIIQAIYANGPIGMRVTIEFLRKEIISFKQL